MSRAFVDDDGEQHSEGEFVGRDDLLDELTRLLLNDTTDWSVALIGAAGVGKTAIVGAWRAQRAAASDLVFHHAARRAGDRGEPSHIARALAAQIEARFPQLRDPFARPEARLAGLLGRVSACELAPHGRRLVLAIDGLDERTTGNDLRDALACLPRRPLPGVRLLVAGRMRDPRRELESRGEPVVPIDLDDACFADDHAAALRGLWRREAAALGLGDGFVERAVGAASGNLLHAALLRKHLAGAPASPLRTGALPRGPAALIESLWQRIAGDRAAVRALEILCAAREPLSLDQIGRVAGWSDPGDLRAAVHHARDLIAEVRRADRVAGYRVVHGAVRAFVIEQLGPIAVRGHHRELADRLATWPLPRDAASRGYALRHAVGHTIAAGDCRAIRAIAGDLGFLEAVCRELGIDAAELAVRRAAESCLALGHMAPHGELDRLLRAIARESSALPRDAGSDAAPLWQRIRDGEAPTAPVRTNPPTPPPPLPTPPMPVSRMIDRAERTAQQRNRPGVISAVLGRASTMYDAVSPSGASDPSGPSAGLGTLAGRTIAPGKPALLGALLGRGGAVTACAVTPDSRRVLAAYADRTLKLWELETGRLVSTLTGHLGVVEGCAISPDGRRAISASADRTLRVWDLRTGAELATLEGHGDAVEACAITPDGRRAVSASADTTLKLWDLETGAELATLEGHGDAVEACAISPDGRWIASASADATLKIWDLETGAELATFRGHNHTVASCAITPDGRHVVSGSADHTLKVWDVGTGRVTTTLKGHIGAVASCAVAPEGRSVYSASADTTLKIWDLDTGRTVTTLDGHARPVTCCAVTPDGRRLISGSTDSTLQVWGLDGRRTSTLPGGTRPPTTGVAHGEALAPRPRKPARAKQLILFLAANSKDGNRRVLEEECAAIDRELVMARHGTDFEFRSKWALTVDEMARHLLDLDPAIVHFRGQGRRDPAEPSGPARDPAQGADSGIYLHDDRGGVQLVTGRALKMMVRSSAPSARVVVLNACYSDNHAAELCQVVDCVVGMSRDHDHAALSFAVAFYRALGHRLSVGDAVAHAVAMLAVKQVPDDCVPRCRTPNWIDPHEISLSPGLGPEPPAP